MKVLPWIVAGVAIGAALAFVVGNAPESGYAGNDPDVEDAARKTSAWGTKQRAMGTGGSLIGKAKEGFGRATGDDEMAGKGMADQAVGTVKDVTGQAAHAVSDAFKNLNR